MSGFRLFAQRFGAVAKNLVHKTTPIEKPPVLPVKKAEEAFEGKFDLEILVHTYCITRWVGK